MNSKSLVVWGLVIFLSWAATAQATNVGYTAQDIGGGYWIYHYAVANDTLGVPVKRFIIWFEADLYEDLSIVSPESINDLWSQSVIEPDPYWLDDGSYRAVALDAGIAVGACQRGFAVRFKYPDPCLPAGQEFDILDPNDYISLEHGWTSDPLHVDADATGNPLQDGTKANPFATIQQGINAAQDGDAVIVEPNTYQENIYFLGKEIVVQSVDPDNWDTISETIIDGDFDGSCVTFDQGEDNSSILQGFTITNGIGTDTVYTFSNGSLSGYMGGGVFCLDSSPIIRHCHIMRNGLDISGPSVADHGGGLALLGDCQAVISNCVIAENGAYSCGDAIVIRANEPNMATSIITHCTIANNGEEYPPAYLYYDVDCWDTNPVISNTIIYSPQRSLLIEDPESVTYSCIRESYFYEYGCGGFAHPYDHTAAGGNISEWPRWAIPPDDICAQRDEWGDCLEFIPTDYHLRRDSPCIDAGDPNFLLTTETDIDSQARVMTGRLDIGADEVAPAIIAVKPLGGEVWAAGSSHQIVWLSYGYSDNVDISYSTNNGTDWTPIATNVVNTGSYPWTLPAVDSDQCRLKVTASVPPDYIEYEGFEQNFTIHPSPAGAPVSSTWPTLGSDFKRSGLSDNPAVQLGCVKWSFAPGGSVVTAVTIGANDRVHLACQDGMLYTLDPNGIVVWTYDVDVPLLSSPTVGPDGTIYVGSEDDRLYAIDPNGLLRWTHKTDGFIYSTTAIAPDGTLYVGSRDGKLHALSSAGSELWSFALSGSESLTPAVLASAAVGNDDNIYVGGLYDPNFYALSPGGTVQWSQQFERLIDPNRPSLGYRNLWIFASPVVASDGTIYVCPLYDTKLHALDPNNGTVNWSLDLADPASGWFGYHYKYDYPSAYIWSEPALGPDGTIYVSFDDPYLRAVNPNGTIKWVTRLGILGGFTITVGSDGLIYVAGDDALMYVVSPTGQQLACFEGSGWLSYPVIAQDGTIYLSDAEDTLWAIGNSDCSGEITSLHRLPDVNGDNIVNLLDFSLHAADWLLCTNYVAEDFCEEPISVDGLYLVGDINRSSYVDIFDLIFLAEQWLNEEQP